MGDGFVFVLKRSASLSRLSALKLVRQRSAIGFAIKEEDKNKTRYR